MLKLLQPPDWTDSDICMRCRTPFTFTNRKHHCRNCGNVFCGACSGKTIPLPHLGITDSVRVDDGCYIKITEKDRHRPSNSPWDFSAQRSHRSHMQPRSARVEDSFDADLKKALAMSLEEAKEESTPGYVTQSKPQTNGNSKPSRTKEDDDDPQLKAAIAASLQDMEEQKKKHAAALKEQSSKPAPTNPAPRPIRNEHELTPVEGENINLFATLVDRLQHQPPGTILREPQIQELYESIGTLRPKLARSYGETMSKHDTLLDLHSKLATVVRYYDRMLEERLNSTYNMHSYGGYTSQASQLGQRPSSVYPSLETPNQPVYTGPQTNMESYYTGSTVPPVDPYARPQSLYSNQAPPSQPNYPPQQPVQLPQRSTSILANNQYPESQSSAPPPPSSSPYMQRRRQNSSSTVSSQRTPSLKYRQSSTDHMPVAINRQPSNYGSMPQQHAGANGYIPSQDPNASYYYGGNTTQPHQQQPQQPLSQAPAASNLYPTLQSPPTASEAPPPQTPYQQTTKPSQLDSSPQAFANPPPPIQPQQPLQPPVQPQSQQPAPPPQAFQHPRPHAYPPNQQQYNASPQPQSYYSNPPQAQPLAASAFPSAPTHQPIAAQAAPQPVEESLIEL